MSSRSRAKPKKPSPNTTKHSSTRRTGSGSRKRAYFSPDGARIAYSAKAHGLVDVYVVDASGGVPQRLTWEPMGNRAVGWTPDGKNVLFASQQASYSDFPRLFRARADGTGTPTVLPLPTAMAGAYSSDAGPGALVYEQFGSIHLYDLATRQEHAVPISIGGDLSGRG